MELHAKKSARLDQRQASSSIFGTAEFAASNRRGGKSRRVCDRHKLRFTF
jgi:hypothetical protein